MKVLFKSTTARYRPDKLDVRVANANTCQSRSQVDGEPDLEKVEIGRVYNIHDRFARFTLDVPQVVIALVIRCFPNELGVFFLALPNLVPVVGQTVSAHAHYARIALLPAQARVSASTWFPYVQLGLIGPAAFVTVSFLEVREFHIIMLSVCQEACLYERHRRGAGSRTLFPPVLETGRRAVGSPHRCMSSVIHGRLRFCQRDRGGFLPFKQEGPCRISPSGAWLRQSRSARHAPEGALEPAHGLARD